MYSLVGRSVFACTYGVSWLHRSPRRMKLHEVRCRHTTQLWTPLFHSSKHFLERGPNKAKAGQASIRSSLKFACPGRQRFGLRESKGPDCPGKRAVGAGAANKEAYLPGRSAGRKPGRPFRAKREEVRGGLRRFLQCLGTISIQTKVP